MNENIISTNYQTCDVFFNDIPKEELSKGYHSLEIEFKKIPKHEKKKMKLNFEKLHASKIKWMSHGQNAFC